MWPGERLAVCVVTRSGRAVVEPEEIAPAVPAQTHGDVRGDRTGTELHAMTFGPPQQAWAAAADVSAETHVRYLEAPVRRVLSILPEEYDDMWTGAKGFYKVEPIVADGGQVVIYAPHIRDIALTHPQVAEIGYHCRDYFVQQWDRFRGYPWGDLAHSTHLRGAGTFDAEGGEGGRGGGRRARGRVPLPPGIPEALTRSINLGYRDPATIDPDAWALDPDTLVV